MLDLDTIFKKRFGGAVNIRGIDYQIIYSLWKALDIYADDCLFTSIEGWA
jgi:hypothetical protein